jgi:hypothetical protein
MSMYVRVSTYCTRVMSQLSDLLIGKGHTCALRTTCVWENTRHVRMPYVRTIGTMVPWYHWYVVRTYVHVYVRTYNVVSQLSDWKRAHMCTANHVCFGRIHGSQLREGANAHLHSRYGQYRPHTTCFVMSQLVPWYHWYVRTWYMCTMVPSGTMVPLVYVHVPWYHGTMSTMVPLVYHKYHGTIPVLVQHYLKNVPVRYHTGTMVRTRVPLVLEYVHVYYWYESTYVHTWFSVHMCALFQSESCDITL